MRQGLHHLFGAGADSARPPPPPPPKTIKDTNSGTKEMINPV